LIGVKNLKKLLSFIVVFTMIFTSMGFGFINSIVYAEGNTLEQAPVEEQEEQPPQGEQAAVEEQEEQPPQEEQTAVKEQEEEQPPQEEQAAVEQQEEQPLQEEQVTVEEQEEQQSQEEQAAVEEQEEQPLQEEQVAEEELKVKSADESTAELDKTEVKAGESVTVDVHIANYIAPEEVKPWGPFDYRLTLYKGKESQGRPVSPSPNETSAEGNGSYEFKIPEDAQAGEYSIKVEILRCDKKELNLEFRVKSADESTAELDKTEVKAGESITVDVHIANYIAPEEVKPWGPFDYRLTLYKGKESQGRPVSPSPNETSAEGNGSYEFKIPKDAQAGEYSIKVEILRCDKKELNLEFRVKSSDENITKLDRTEVKQGENITIDINEPDLKDTSVTALLMVKVNEPYKNSEEKVISNIIDLDSEGKGSCTITIPQDLQPGDRHFSVYNNDVYNKQLNFAVLDNTPPGITVTGLEDNATVHREELTFVVTVSDNKDSEVKPVVKLDGIDMEPKDGSYKVNLTEGENTITIDAEDTSGNKAETQTYKITYIKELVNGPEAPKITVDGIENNYIVFENQKLKFTAAAVDEKDGALTPVVKLNGKEVAPLETGKYELTLKLEGDIRKTTKNTVAIEAVDNDGNKGCLEYIVYYTCGGLVVLSQTEVLEGKGVTLSVNIGIPFDDYWGKEYSLSLQKKGFHYYKTPDGKQIIECGKLDESGRATLDLNIPSNVEPQEYYIVARLGEGSNITNYSTSFKVKQSTDTIPPEIKTVFRDLGAFEPGETKEIHSNFAILKATAYDLTDGVVDVTVMLNGEKVERMEPMEYCRYRLELKEGSNTIVVESSDKAGNKSTEKYNINSTKDNLNKISLKKYRVNAGNNLELSFDMNDYEGEKAKLILYNCDIDYYHKASREFYTDQGLPEIYAFQPYNVEIQLDSEGQLKLDYGILENVRSGYYMLEGGFGGSVYRSPVFYVAGNEPDVISPEIYLRGIEDGFVYNESEVEFSVIANDAREGKVNPVVEINGKSLEAQKEGNYIASLVEGDNTIEIFAEDSKGNVTTNQISIEYVKVDINNESVIKTKQAIKLTSHYLKNNSTHSSDWRVVGIANAGKAVQKEYLADMEKWAETTNATSDKVTDYERIALGVSAAGGDPRNIGGYNLIDKIYNYDEQGELYFQGLNGVIYGLIAMDTNRYFVPSSALYTREDLVEFILEKQNSDGGWDLYMDEKSDVDITAMTLISLAPYHHIEGVSEAVGKATDWLSDVQRKDNGGFDSWGSENNSESVSQTIIGLCANGIDPTSDEFTKDGNTLIDALLSFAQDDGTFLHVQTGSGEPGVTGMSTEQAYQALLAYDKFVKMGRKSKDGKASIYYFGEKLADAKGLVMGMDLDEDNNRIAKINVENLGDKKQKVLLIIAMYDEENRMVNSIKVNDEIGVNENKVIYKEYTVPEGENYTVKVFLWDSLEGQNPLKAHPIIIKAN
jgi:hypothetical protein